MMRAGQLAAEQLAWEEAAVHWDAALEVMPDAGVEPEHRARLLERLGDLKYAANFDVERGTAQLEEALACYEAAGDRSRAARARSRIGRNLGTYWGPLHDVRRAREHLDAAEAVLREEGEGVPLASVYLGRATVAIWELDIPEIVGNARRATEISERIGGEAALVNARILYGQGLWWGGKRDEGTRIVEEEWQAADRLNNAWLAFLATWCIQGAAVWLGDPRASTAVCDRELSRSRMAHGAGQREFLENFRGARGTRRRAATRGPRRPTPSTWASPARRPATPRRSTTTAAPRTRSPAAAASRSS